MKILFHACLVLGLVTTSVSVQAQVACPAGPVASGFTGTTSQLGRIFRDAVPSVCPTKPYPGIFNNTTAYNYQTYTYSNTSGAAACVTVSFNPDTSGATPCGTNAHMSAYQGSYDPANQATNFLGDVGSSTTQSFAFQVAGNSALVLAVTNTSAQAVCTFGFEVSNLPCQAGVPAVFLPVPSQDYRGLMLLGSLLAGLGCWYAVRRRRHS